MDIQDLRGQMTIEDIREHLGFEANASLEEQVKDLHYIAAAIMIVLGRMSDKEKES